MEQNYLQTKVLLFVVPVFVFVVFVGLVFHSPVLRAGFSHAVMGWAWGGSQDTVTPTTSGLGWVSLNSSDCDTNDDGLISAAEAGVNGCTAGVIANYGISIPAAVGSELSGYAWSENYGWISFEKSDAVQCPSGVCSARRTLAGIEGWARILSLRISATDGGWIKMASDATDTVPYNVTYDQIAQNFGGYAYSNEVGWIDFSPIVPPPAPSNLTVVPCVVPDESNTCNGQVTAWDITGAVAPNIARIIPAPVVELSTLAVGVAPVSVPLLYGTNHVVGRDGAVVIESTRKVITIGCSADSFYHSDSGIEVCKAKPLITATPSVVWVRTGKVAEVDFSVTANYQVECSLAGLGGGALGPTTHLHNGAPANSVYTSITAPLTAAQVIEISCEVPGLPDSKTVQTVRVNVLPGTQEI